MWNPGWPNLQSLARHPRWLIVAFIAVVALGAAASAALVGYRRGWPLRADERVVLFTTAAHLTDQGWLVPIHGWVFEPETDDAIRSASLAVVNRALGLEPRAPAGVLLDERLRWFLVDNQGSKRVVVRVAGREQTFGPTGADGHFRGTVLVAAEVAARLAPDGALGVEALTPAGPVAGTVLLVPPTGLSVISDVDDTVKVTEVTDKRALLRNTLLADFRPVAGMPELYRRLSATGASFHYVSSSPWQLYPPLVAFLREARFPLAALELRRVRWKELDLAALFGDPRVTKPPAIEAVMATYPRRRFCLVGDSGEKDPEVYGEIARRHRDQVACIFIRNVTAEPNDSPRYGSAFRGIDPERWRVFTDPGELDRLP